MAGVSLSAGTAFATAVVTAAVVPTAIVAASVVPAVSALLTALWGTIYFLNRNRKKKWPLFFKAFATCMPLGEAFFYCLLDGFRSPLRMGIAVGALFCAAADVLLELHFLSGMAVFALGHICFLAVLLRLSALSLPHVLFFLQKPGKGSPSLLRLQPPDVQPGIGGPVPQKSHRPDPAQNAPAQMGRVIRERVRGGQKLCGKIFLRQIIKLPRSLLMMDHQLPGGIKLLQSRARAPDFPPQFPLQWIWECQYSSPSRGRSSELAGPCSRSQERVCSSSSLSPSNFSPPSLAALR